MLLVGVIQESKNHCWVWLLANNSVQSPPTLTASFGLIGETLSLNRYNTVVAHQEIWLNKLITVDARFIFKSLV
jgi:urease accessory protein UreF